MRRYSRIFIIPLIFIFILLVLAYLPFLRINAVEVKGGGKKSGMIQWLIRENLNKRTFLFLPSDNIFLIQKKNLGEEIKKNFPEIKEVNVKISAFSRKITAEIKERQIFAFICRDNNCFYLDDEGMLFSRAPLIAGNIVMEVAASSTVMQNVYLGQKISQESFGTISGLVKKFEEVFHEKPSKVILKNDNVFEFLLASGLRIIFDSEIDFQKIFRNLNIALQNIKEKEKLDYIDLRFGNKVYYKFKQ